MRGKKRNTTFAYLKHWLLKEDQYSQQSPFIYSVYQGALDFLKKETPSASKEEKVALLIAYFCQLTDANQVLELGTGNETKTRLLNQVTKGQVYRISEPAALSQGMEVFQQSILELPALDFVLIHSHFSPALMPELEALFLPRMHAQGLLLLEGIHQHKEMNATWQGIQADTRIRLSLDFFDFGVAFLSYSGPKSKLYLSY